MASKEEKAFCINWYPNDYSKGWIRLFRSIRAHWIWDDPEKLKWWLDILLEVNHEAKKVCIGAELYECGRGESIRSIKEWAKRWRVSEGRVSRFLEMLEKDGMVYVKSETKTTRITVCNYAYYNDTRSANGAQTNLERSGSDAQTGTNKNDNNYKNYKEYTRVRVFEELGVETGMLSEKVKIALDRFLQYRENRKEQIKDYIMFENIIRTMLMQTDDEDKICFMLSNTMAKGAKNVITDLTGYVAPVKEKVKTAADEW